jgi:hypothetical protein
LSEQQDRLEQLSEELRRAQEELEAASIEASAGKGAVTVRMSGTQECLSIRIEPRMYEGEARQELEQLLILAINQAIKDSQLLAARRLSPFTDQLGS